jgi:hypothetical protein
MPGSPPVAEPTENSPKRYQEPFFRWSLRLFLNRRNRKSGISIRMIRDNHFLAKASMKICSFPPPPAGIQQGNTPSLRISALPKGIHLNNFDCMFQPSVEKEKIDFIANCEFIRQQENVLFFGPSGVGKTQLAAGPGVRAVEMGLSVDYLGSNPRKTKCRFLSHMYTPICVALFEMGDGFPLSL